MKKFAYDLVNFTKYKDVTAREEMIARAVGFACAYGNFDSGEEISVEFDHKLDRGNAYVESNTIHFSNKLFSARRYFADDLDTIFHEVGHIYLDKQCLQNGELITPYLSVVDTLRDRMCHLFSKSPAINDVPILLNRKFLLDKARDYFLARYYLLPQEIDARSFARRARIQFLASAYEQKMTKRQILLARDIENDGLYIDEKDEELTKYYKDIIEDVGYPFKYLSRAIFEEYLTPLADGVRAIDSPKLSSDSRNYILSGLTNACMIVFNEENARLILDRLHDVHDQIALSPQEKITNENAQTILMSSLPLRTTQSDWVQLDSTNKSWSDSFKVQKVMSYGADFDDNILDM